MLTAALATLVGGSGFVAFVVTPAVAASPTILTSPASPQTYQGPTQETWTVSGGGRTATCSLVTPTHVVVQAAETCRAGAVTFTIADPGSYQLAYSPATGAPVYSSTLVLTPPAPTVALVTTSPSSDPTPTWTFTTLSTTTAACEVDYGGAALQTVASCTSPFTADNLGASPTAGPGTYTLNVTQSRLGVTSDPGSSTYDFEPATPATPTVTADVATGSSRHPGFSVGGLDGVATPKCTVTPSANAAVTGCAAGSPSLDLTGADDGTYTLHVTQTYAHQTSAEGTATYLLDTTAPGAPTLTASAPYGADVHPSFAVSDLDHDAHLADCSVSGPTSSVSLNGCDSGMSLDLSSADAGTYTVTADAVDAVGNTSASASATYEYLPGPPPAPEVSAPAATGNDDSPTFAIDDSEAAPLSYSCTLSGGSIGSEAVTPCTANTTIDLSGADDGTYTLSVTATDDLDQTSATGTATYTLDTSTPAPVVTFASGTSSPSASANATFGLSDSETVSGPDTFTCIWAGPDGRTLSSGSCADGVSFTAGPANGTYTLAVTAHDSSGNVSTTALGFAFEGSAPPAPDVAVVGGPTGSSSVATFSIDDKENVDDLSYTCTLSGGPIVSQPITPCGSSTTVDLGGAPDGAYTLAVTAQDGTGHSSAAGSATYTLDTVAQAPTVTLTPPLVSPSNNSAPSFTIVDNETVDAPDTFACTWSGPGIPLAVAAGCTSGDTFTPLTDGTYALSVTATDAVGNVSAPVTVSYVFDSTAPAAPTVVQLTPAGSPGTTTQPTFGVSVPGDASPGGVSFKCSVTNETTGAHVPPADVTCGPTTSLDLSASGDGSYTLTVSATDTAGNTSVATGSATYVLDGTAQQPTVTLADTGGSPGTSANPTFSISGTEVADGPDSFACTWSGPDITTPSASPCHTGDGFPAGTDGAYTLSVIATDQLGNSSTAATATYRRDTVAQSPTVGLVSPSASPGRSATARFRITDNEIVAGPDTFTCTWTGPGITASGAACGSTPTETAGADGTYTLSVIATDSLGNQSLPATATYQLDTAAQSPTVSLATPAGSPGHDSAPTFAIVDNELVGGPDSFTCTWDGPGITATTAACASGDAFTTAGDGTYTLSVTAQDSAGNLSPPVTATYVYDGTAPATPTVVRSSPLSSPGTATSVSFSVTNPGDGSPGGLSYSCTATYKPTAGGAVTVLPAADITRCGATTTLAVAALGDARYTVAVIATDAAGNSSDAAGTAAYTLDATAPAAPTVTLATPPNSPGNATTPAFTVTNPGDLSPGGITYTCSVTGQTVVPASAITCGTTTSVDLSGAGRDGSYTLSVVATDKAGNVGPAGTASYVLDATAPAAPLVTLATPASSPGRSTAPAFTVSNAGDASPGGVTYTCAVTGRTVVRPSAITCGTTTLVDLSGAGRDGTYTLAVTATDAAGNVSPAGTASYVLDTTAPGSPTVVLATPASSPGHATSPTFTLTNSGDSSPGGLTYSCLVTETSSTPVVTLPASRVGCGPTTTVDLTGGDRDGDYQLAVTATDAAGNASTSAGTATYSLDTTAPPLAAIVLPAAAARQPIFGITDGDATASLTCTLIAPRSIVVFGPALCPSTGMFDTRAYDDGDYSLTVQATDRAGNSSVASVTWTRDTTPPPPPTVAAPVSPSDDRTPTFAIEDTDPTATLSCLLTGPGSSGATAFSGTCPADGVFRVAGADGDYTLTVSATDAAGNSQPVTATATYTLDTTAPNPPDVTLVLPASSPGTLSLPKFLVTDPDPGPGGVTYFCSVTGPTTVLASDIHCGDTTSVDLSGAGRDGQYTLSVIATDTAGNTNPVAGTATYVLDTTPPPVPVVRLLDPVSSPGFDVSPTFAVSDSDPSAGVTYTCEVSGATAVPASAIDCGAVTTVDLSGTARDGTYTLSVVATDAAGNVNEQAGSVSYALDTVPPDAPIVRLAASTRSRDDSPLWTWAFAPNDTETDADTATCVITEPSGATVSTPDCRHHYEPALTGGDGIYSLTVRLTDPAGNTATNLDPPTYHLDSQAPAGAEVTNLSPHSGIGLSRHPEWSISGPPNSRFECALFQGSEHGPMIAPNTDCTSPVTYNLTGQSDGIYVVRVDRFDAAGNQSFPAWGTYLLEPDAPRVEAPTGNDSQATWSISGNPADHFECTLLQAGSVVVPSRACSAHPTFDMATRVAGKYTLSAIQIGAEGARSAPGAANWEWAGGETSTHHHHGHHGVKRQRTPPPTRSGHHPKPRKRPGDRTRTRVPSVLRHRIHHFVDHTGATATQHLQVLPHPVGLSAGVASAVQNVVHTLGVAGGGTGFPLLLLGLVVAFLAAQNRIDRRDPKLALASIAADDLVDFQLPPSREERP